jgi:uncharacterized sporulation protein YeaH/YhbH (DUF444 family)
VKMIQDRGSKKINFVEKLARKNLQKKNQREICNKKTQKNEMQSIGPNHNRSKLQQICKNTFSSDLLSQAPEKVLNEAQKNNQK